MSAREWQPGDVAVATIQGERVRLIYNEDRGAGTWYTERWVKDGQGNDRAGWIPADIKDARPLVVIDPEDREQVERLGKAIYDNGFTASGRLADALREFANPTPPKPEEPTGLGAVVEDAKGRLWVRCDADDTPWYRVDSDDWYSWRNVKAARVLSEGWSK